MLMRRVCTAALIALSVLLTACGGNPPDNQAVAPPAATEPAALPEADPGLAAPAPERDTLDQGAALGGPDADDAQRINDFVGGLLGAAQNMVPPGADSADAPGAGPMPVDPQARMAEATAKLEAQKALMAEVMAAMQNLGTAGSDPDKRTAAQQRLKKAELAMRRSQIKADSDRRAAALDSLPEEWKQVRRVVRDDPEAELLVQLGDIDNLGFGWPAGFDPFSGKSTPVHRFPWTPEDDDPPGTDRIMVISGYNEAGKARRDGYTQQTTRPDNLPEPLRLEFELDGIEVKAAALQLFVDDFQSERMGSRYRAWLDGREAPDLAVVLNALDQTGPIGKLLTIQLLPEYLDLIADGKLEILIDDPDNDAGDGYAFDFARLLVNPKGYKYTGTVRGIAVDTQAGRPLAGVLVSAANVRQALTDEKGSFLLAQVPAGLVVTTGSKPGYSPDSEAADLEHGQTVDLVLELAPDQQDSGSLAKQLERVGKVDLYGIYFDTAKATLKPESGQTLQQVLGVLNADVGLRLIIAGHTDSEGGDDYNQELSERRAASVVAWLTEKGVAANRLTSEGLGESRPVADNRSEAGRALNRRVEVRVAD